MRVVRIRCGLSGSDWEKRRLRGRSGVFAGTQITGDKGFEVGEQREKRRTNFWAT